MSGVLMLIIGRPLTLWQQLLLTSGVLLLSFLWGLPCDERVKPPNETRSAADPATGAARKEVSR